MKEYGKLSVVATPIGNMGDFSARAKSTLLSADVIVAEDTRSLRSLLPDENIKALLIRGDSITEKNISEKVLKALEYGQNVAMITDAGTPGISDPGYIIIKKVREDLPEVKIEAIPGPSALISALSISGVPATPFSFFGFPPAKKGRQTFFTKIAEIKHTVVLYESPHRFMKTLLEIQAVMHPENKIFIGRELTKVFEEGKYGTIAEIISYYENSPDKVRGEFVIVLDTK